MTTFLITAPDGTKYNVSGPDGSNEQDALAQVQAQHAPQQVRSYDAIPGGIVPTGSPAAIAAHSPIAQGDPNSAHPVTDEIGAALENMRAGAGKYFADLGRGISQKFGGTSYQEVADARARDAPLMATTAGKIGNVGAGIVTTAPALAIPGANTVAGATAIGGLTGALQPAASAQEAVTNPIIGAATGAFSQAAGQKIGQYASDRLAARAATEAEQTTTNSARDAVLQEGRKAGYVVPPTEVNPSATATALESISGKAATKQAAQAVNQKVTNGLVSKDLGLPATQPITPEALAGVRAEAGKVYQQVKQVGNISTDSEYLDALTKITNASDEVSKAFPGAATPAAEKIDNLVSSLSQDQFSAAQALEYTKRLRQQASSNFTVAARSGDPEARALAQAQSKGADALEEMIGRHLDSQGNPELLQAFQDARKTIAKSYQAQAALKGGNVNAQRLAQQLQKGKPMSDGFGLVARFADHFGDATKLPKGGVGVSKLAATVGGGGALTAAFTGNLPLAGALAGGTAAPYAVRSSILSGAGQRALATPNYAPGALGTLALKGLQQAPNVALPLGLQAPRLAQGNQ